MEHDLPRSVTVQARSLVVLNLKQLEQVCLLVRRAEDAQMAVAVGEEDPGGGGVEKFDTSRRQRGEYVDDVEVAHESVDDLDARRCGQGLAGSGCGERVVWHVHVLVSDSRSSGRRRRRVTIIAAVSATV